MSVTPRAVKLCFPDEILDQHLVVLGKTGAGKSSALRHIVEHLLSRGKRVCIIDPKGDWWGLKASADGKGPGYPIITFGDFKKENATDVPINQQSGKHVAELITSGNRPAIIGFRGWMTAHMVQFWIDFASGIFNANSGELYLVGDEFHNFAPKGKILDPQAGKCLHWSNRLLSEGRGLGIVCLIASQRPQKVHNDTLTSCETLVAMRVIHAADRGAVEDWIKGCGDKEQGKEVLDTLARLARGSAWIWSPEIDFGPIITDFPIFKTFDSFAPPQLQKKVNNRSWADVDLAEVTAKLASVIEEAKANDPRELKEQLTVLRRQLEKAQRQPSPSIETAPKAEELRRTKRALQQAMKILVNVIAHDFKEVPQEELKAAIDSAVQSAMSKVQGIIEARTKTFEKLRADAANAVKVMKGMIDEEIPIAVHVRHNEPFTITPPSRPRVTVPRIENGLSKCERTILSALAQYPQGRSSTQVAILTGYSGTSGGFNNSLSRLRSAPSDDKPFGNCITRGNPIQITEGGLSTLGDWKPLPTGQGLLDHWLGRSSKCERTILETLAANYPNGMTADEIGAVTGYSASSGGFNNSLSRLRTLELITRGQPIRISEEFYQ
jgi:hypothetical protein